MASKAVAGVGKKGLMEVIQGHAAGIPQASRLAENVMNLTGLSGYTDHSIAARHPKAPALQPRDYPPVETKVSTLSNGVKVVSRDTHDSVSVVGTFLDAGSRDCTGQSSGVGHFMESIALEATENRSGLNLYTEIQKAGANLAVTASRDGIMYQCELFRND